MRLLHTPTFELREFVGHGIPKYAILSHRWEEEEITFDDIVNLHNLEDKANRKSWSKIHGCCRQGAADGFDWVWIDSCCINKASSAELTEAINSMYDWYKRAQVCYVYLSDVPGTEQFPEHYAAHSAFRQSKWFTRGWTLQELLAPPKVEFYNSDWKNLGNKFTLGGLVSRITGIEDLHQIDDACIAQKMSWASKRQTTRVEDRAYSLLGLFGVNMPPLYGEGENAFVRLQLELIRISDDESIFAWLDSSNKSSGLLASSPAAFEFSGDVNQLEFENDRPSYSMTNKGLSMEAHFMQSEDPESLLQILHVDDTFLVPLQCMLRAQRRRLALRLRHVERDQYARITSNAHVLMDEDQQNLYEATGQAQSPRIDRNVRFHVQQRAPSDMPFKGPYHFSLEVFSPTYRLPTYTQSTESQLHYVSNPLRGVWGYNLPGQNQILPIFRADSLAKSGITAGLVFIERESTPSKETNSGRKFFVLVLNVFNHKAAVGLLTPPKVPTTKDLKHVVGDFFQRPDWKTRINSTSVTLDSRERVTATLTTLGKIASGSNTVESYLSYQVRVKIEGPPENRPVYVY